MAVCLVPAYSQACAPTFTGECDCAFVGMSDFACAYVCMCMSQRQQVLLHTYMTGFTPQTQRIDVRDQDVSVKAFSVVLPWFVDGDFSLCLPRLFSLCACALIS